MPESQARLVYARHPAETPPPKVDVIGVLAADDDAVLSG
jgi:hypothetical protein